MNKIFKVAAVQLNFDKNTSSLVKDIKNYIQKAKTKGADIVCFPESSLSAGPKKNKLIISQIKKECEKNKIWCILVGHLKEKKHVYNSAVLINDKGGICGKHKKVYVCDVPHIHAGSSFDIYNTPFCKIGIAICWDISHPDAIYTLVKKGAKLVFCPMYWHYELWAHEKEHKKSEKKILQSLILTRAFENIVYVVFCNAYNKSQSTLTSYSAIAEPHKIIKGLFDKEGMIVADINLDYLEKIRKKYLREYSKKISP